MSQSNLFKFDVRIRERLLKRGAVDAKEVEKHLKELPDAASNAEILDLSQPALTGDEDDDEGDEG